MNVYMHAEVLSYFRTVHWGGYYAQDNRNINDVVL